MPDPIPPGPWATTTTSAASTARQLARAENSEMASRSPPKACPAVIVPATSPPARSSAASREKASGRAPPSVIT